MPWNFLMEPYHWASLGVTLITLGIVPWAVSRNARQHRDGQQVRDQIAIDLKEVKGSISTVKNDILDMKIDDISTRSMVAEMKMDRANDKQDYIEAFDLFKKEIKNEIVSLKRTRNFPSKN